MVSKSVNEVIDGVIKRPFCCSGRYAPAGGSLRRKV